MKAYAALCYIRFVTENNVYCILLCAKSKVAPLKKLTVPRLELLSCLLLSKLMMSVKNGISNILNVKDIFYWNDSEISLCRIRNLNKELKTWEQNRVNLIRNYSDYEKWNYVATSVNPADLPTRGNDIKSLPKNNHY